MQTVVLGYVSKPEGRAALTASIVEATRRGARLVVVNAHRTGRDDPQAQTEHEADLAAAVEEVDAAGLDYELMTPQAGLDVAEELVRIAEDAAADLIVIGLRRRSPAGKLILGSSAQRILLDAHCPVLAVKSD